MRAATRTCLAVLVLVAAREARPYDSHCGVGASECPDGYVAARTRWGVGDAGVEDARAEHATLWLRSRAASGLPASLDEKIELPVFTRDEDLPGGLKSVRPVLTGAERSETRTTSLAEMAQLPDFSYTLWDWATGNELCPPDPAQDPLECHEYFPHVGLLNSNHMVPQAQRFYEHYHALALGLARDCRAVHDLIPADQRSRFRAYVLACEKEALLVEAVGQHFLQDAWSMGHMWERWGGPEVSDFGDDRTLGAAIAAFSGIIHGARELLGEGFDDPLCAPHPGVGYIEGGADGPALGDQLGLGDLFVDGVLLDPPTGDLYGPQRRALLGCAVDGMRAVYSETAREHSDGALGAPDVTAIDTTRRVTDPSCWGQRATNQALGVGFGLHIGLQPNQTPLLEVIDPLLEDFDPSDPAAAGAFPAGIIAWALSEYAARVGLAPLDPTTAERFRRDAAEAATMAATAGADPDTGLLTTLAAGGLPPLVGIGPNSHYARGGTADPANLPTTYIDPPLPWGLLEPGPIGEEKQALALLFADAHVADRCRELTAADLEGYRAAVEDAGDDSDRRAAACGQCTQMVMPHLRFGVPGNHDARREALCQFLAAGAGFVFTEEDPTTFTGDEPTDLASLRAAAQTFCGCEEKPPDIAGTWIGRFVATSHGIRSDGCAGMSITEDAGALRLDVCTADWCGAPDAFGNCAAVFDATLTGTSFGGLMVDNTGGCCRGCVGQERGWENGCRITGALSTGTDGLTHLTASTDSGIGFCFPSSDVITFDLVPPGPPGCGNCVIDAGEECEPPGITTVFGACGSDCRRPPSPPD